MARDGFELSKRVVVVVVVTCVTRSAPRSQENSAARSHSKSRPAASCGFVGETGGGHPADLPNSPCVPPSPELTLYPVPKHPPEAAPDGVEPQGQRVGGGDPDAVLALDVGHLVRHHRLQL